MFESIVKHLICPDTNADLKLNVYEYDGIEIIEGELVSVKDNNVRYPIHAGIPRFLQIENLHQEQRDTVEAFATKWSKIPGYAFEETTKVNRERWYFQRFGFPNGDRELKYFLKGANYILEAGTGTGVDTDLLLRNFDGLLFGIDISSAIDIAYERFRNDKRVVLLQADIGRLPFRPGFFDVISCDQVLHHTPNPPEYFQRLTNLLADSGRLLMYVYSVKGPLREYADDHLRGSMTQVPLEDCIAFSEKMARLGRNLSRLQALVEVEDDIPELSIRAGSYDVQRLIYDHILKCFWNEAYDFDTNAMINFDWYRPKHAFRYTEPEVRVWVEKAGLHIQHLDICPSGISLIMRK